MSCLQGSSFAYDILSPPLFFLPFLSFFYRHSVKPCFRSAARSWDRRPHSYPRVLGLFMCYVCACIFLSVYGEARGSLGCQQRMVPSSNPCPADGFSSFVSFPIIGSSCLAPPLSFERLLLPPPHGLPFSTIPYTWLRCTY